MTLLEDFWCGNLSPSERPPDKNSPSHLLQRQAMDVEKRLMNTFSPEQKALFFDYEAAETAKASALEAEAFSIGFRLAVQLLLAGMQS